MVEQGRLQGERPSHTRTRSTSFIVVWEGRSPCGRPSPLYPLDANMLLQAIDELIEYCKGNDSKLARRLLWLNVFLKRAETLPLIEKTQVKERLDMFDELLEQDEFVQKQRARGRQEGRAEGRAEGQIEAFQMILVDIVKNKFPSLEELAQKQVAQIRQVDALREVIKIVNGVNDENVARVILNSAA